APAEEELAVVIILDDPGAGGFGGAEEGEAALEAHDVAERLLMRGRHEGEAEGAGAAQPFLDAEALLVDRHRDEVGAAGEKAVARADRARHFEPHLVAGIEQHRADEVESLLRAGEDEDLASLAGNAAIGAEMRGDRLAQGRVPERRAIAHPLLAGAAPMLRGKPRPLRHGKGVEGGEGGDESAWLMGQARALAETLGRPVDGLGKAGRPRTQRL